MTSFGWKRKIGENVSKSATCKFKEVTGTKEIEDDIDDSEDGEDSLKWLGLAQKRKMICLEDSILKSQRLRDEGTILAEAERYWEAIKKWDEALAFTPLNDKLLEMKAQAQIVLNEVFPAVQTAELAVKANPQWWVTYQTLGRAQMGLGEIQLAIKNFSRAIHIKPDEPELWQEDLQWACTLLHQEKDQGTKKMKRAAGKTADKLTPPPDIGGKQNTNINTSSSSSSVSRIQDEDKITSTPSPSINTKSQSKDETLSSPDELNPNAYVSPGRDDTVDQVTISSATISHRKENVQRLCESHL